MRHSGGNHLLDSDVALLDILSAPTPEKSAFSRRDASLDPLMIAAALASGPHVTRNHYHHDFFPAAMMPQAEGAWDWTKWQGEDAGTKGRPRLTYISRQAPRRVRLQTNPKAEKENDPREVADPLKSLDNLPAAQRKCRSSLAASPAAPLAPHSAHPVISVNVQCMARTRIPTPHGSVFLHLYHTDRDSKEHLAIVVDPAQFSNPSSHSAPPIRSRSLDAVWNESETEMDRITRGAYVGRLTPISHHASLPPPPQTQATHHPDLPAPLVRIHSECFTGETVGSMRCDCGEQLDEALRLISQPITLSSSPNSPSPITIPGRGAVIYLRQEGRGIGLLSKIRAYNLQDLGHDTVTANLMLGHQADERGYEVAAAILRDLGMGDGVRVLTNNPDKVQALESEGVKVHEHVSMIPRSWQQRQQKAVSPGTLQAEMEKGTVGVTLIGGGIVHGEDLDKYLRTKVLRMGHMLPLWLEGAGK